MVRTGATFEDAAEEWHRHGIAEREWKPSTARDYRSALTVHLIPDFGEMPLEDVTANMIERWRAQKLSDGVPRRTAQKMTSILHSIFERARRAYGLPFNPVADVERLRIRYDAGDYDFYSVEQVYALVRAADNDTDAAIFLTAAFSGLRLGELLALRVRDVDFEAEALRVFGSVDIIEGLVTTKSGRGRTVPMVPQVGQALAALLQRDLFTGPYDPVFVGETGRHLDGSALRRRYKEAQQRAGLPRLRFHDLRHTFGSLAVTTAESTRELQEWLGHADARTTARYTHYKPRRNEARRLARAFTGEDGVPGKPTARAAL